jgi:esterase/lipase superfamily enzyme
MIFRDARVTLIAQRVSATGRGAVFVLAHSDGNFALCR